MAGMPACCRLVTSGVTHLKTQLKSTAFFGDIGAIGREIGAEFTKKVRFFPIKREKKRIFCVFYLTFYRKCGIILVVKREGRGQPPSYTPPLKNSQQLIAT